MTAPSADLAARVLSDDGTVADLGLTLTVGDVEVPGAWWLPSGRTEVTGTVCIGHGGFQHKRADNVEALARQLVTELGVGVVALDAPEHGDRVTDPDTHAAQLAALSSRDPDRRATVIGERGRAVMAERARTHVSEWRALLDRLEDEGPTGPIGWWGVSMGTTHGIPLIGRDERIVAAVLGLNALRPDDDAWRRAAAAVTIPVLYLMQWSDELMTRDEGFALWDALGSKVKTLHLNPGGHVAVPRAERDAAVAFYRRWLLP